MATVPDAPQIQIRPRGSNEALSFWWGPPVSDGGEVITGYLLQTVAGDISGAYGPEVGQATLTGLTNYTQYAFTLSAQNAVGYGPAAAFRVVQPGISPPGPSDLSMNRITDGVASVSWTPSGATGASSIGWYVVSAKPLDASGAVIKRSAHGYDTSRYFDNLSTMTTYNMLIQAVNDTSYSPPTTYTTPLTFGFLPSDISGLTLWLDAADPTTLFQDSGATINAIFDGQPVTLWRDKSVKQSSFSVFDEFTVAPKFRLKGFNATFPSVYFNGIDISGEGLKASAITLTNSNTLTQFYVFQVPYINFNSVFPIFYDASDNNWLTYDNSPSALFGDVDSSGNPITFDGSFNMVPILVTQYADLSNSYMYTISPSFHDISGIRFGDSLNVSQSYLFGYPFETAARMYLAETLHYDGVLNAVQRDTVEGYLGHKWGLIANVTLDGQGVDLSGNSFFQNFTLDKPTQILEFNITNVTNIGSVLYIWVYINTAGDYTGMKAKIDHADYNVNKNGSDYYIQSTVGGEALPLVPSSKIKLILPRPAMSFDFGVNSD